VHPLVYRPSRVRTIKLAAPALIVAWAALLPFIDKPFTIDDPIFLLQAKHALEDPLHPAAFFMVWDDTFDAGIPRRGGSVSGPVMAWLLIPTVAAGGMEWIAHLTQLVFLSAAIVATVSLALRLGTGPRGALAAGLLVAAAPAVLGMAGTAMPDVPAMALGVVGVERLLAWRDERRGIQVLAAVSCLALAMQTRAHLLLIPGIAGLLAVGSFLDVASWRARWRAVVPLAGALVLSAAVALVVRDPHPAPGVLASPVGALDRVPRNVVAFAAGWVLTVPLAIPWMLLRPRELLRRWPVFVAATACAGAVLVMTRSPQVAIALVAGGGVAVIVDILVDAGSRRDTTQLALGLWLLIPLAPAPYMHLPPKFLLAAVPAAAILVARRLGSRDEVRGWLALAGVATMGVALSVAILAADAAFAEVGRRATAELIAPGVARGDRVWFVGSWGFHWYATAAGARPVTVTIPHPEPGDLVAISERSSPSTKALELLGRYPRATLVGRVEAEARGGRVMDAPSGAGFFSNLTGYLPWTWSAGRLDRIDLWRLDAAPVSP